MKNFWQNAKFYAVMSAIALMFIAVFVGLFFLKSYRWGNCS